MAAAEIVTIGECAAQQVASGLTGLDDRFHIARENRRLEWTGRLSKTMYRCKCSLYLRLGFRS